jgi:CHAT domain-containing protein
MPKADILHFATHGFANADFPLTSGILLSPNKATDFDGALQGWEILTGPKLKARLVVLSACETARGQTQRNEGVVGLTRAFQIMGAESLVASVWKVADDSTAKLLVSFHKHLKEGKDKATALQLAMLEIASNPETSSPYFWAPFLLLGDDAPLFEEKK